VGLTNNILKALVVNILTQFRYIFNLVLTTSVVFHSFKNTVIIVLYKQSIKNYCTNNRPIVFTITLSKVLEMYIKDRLYSLIETYPRFSNKLIGLQESQRYK